MRQIFFFKNKAVAREMAVPSTLWVAYWEWDGAFGFSGDTFTVEEEQRGQKPHLEHSAACAWETNPFHTSDFLLVPWF